MQKNPKLKYQPQQMLKGNAKPVPVVPKLDERFHPDRRQSGPTSTRRTVGTVPTQRYESDVYISAPKWV